MNQNKGIAIAVRFFTADQLRVDVDRIKITKFLEACFVCDSVVTVYVAVNPNRDIGDSITFLDAYLVPESKQLIVIPVTPWGRYIEPLNALALRAATDGYEQVLFVNTEHEPTNTNIAELSRHFFDDTLVVGAAINGFHDFEVGEHEMNGMRVPADAFMLMNIRLFSLYGFIAVSEAPWMSCMKADEIGTPNDPGMKEAGMKEVPTFALIQHMLGKENAKVKLVRITGADRDTSTITGARKALDDHKRASALTRAKKQMELAHIPNGYVIHL